MSFAFTQYKQLDSKNCSPTCLRMMANQLYYISYVIRISMIKYSFHKLT
jgi:hypothetical protein